MYPPRDDDRERPGWRNRGALEIMELILSACLRGSLKTRVMYKCKLNSKQLEQYLEFLLRHELLSRDQVDPRSKKYGYKTTPKGRKYINTFKELKRILDLSLINSDNRIRGSGESA